jgi:predicted GNAT superfamily acetyltransferase
MNEEAVPNVNSLRRDQVEWFLTVAPYFRIAEMEGRIAGFLIGLGPGVQYESVNYRWFTKHHPQFIYVDRIVIAPFARRRGIGRILYEDFAAFGRARAPVMTCEVNLHPPNPGSMDFHRAMGFEQVGTQETEGGAKTVAMLVRKL